MYLNRTEAIRCAIAVDFSVNMRFGLELSICSFLQQLFRKLRLASFLSNLERSCVVVKDLVSLEDWCIVFI